MNNTCNGCGSKFQSLNQKSPGYIPKEKLNDSDYCERCFKILHYGEDLVVLTPKEINVIIKTVNNDQKHVLFILDILSLNEDIINIYKQINYPKTMIINKYDLVKHLIKPNKIKEYLRSYYQVEDNILFITAINNHNVNELLVYLSKYKIKEAYLVGFINAGKSTLINTILSSNNQSILGLTTSYIPHTTMNFINMKVSDDLILIDSPGFTYPDFLSNNLSILKKIDVKKKIKPITYQMKENQSLVIEDLLNITFLNKVNTTVYMSNKFSIKKAYKVNRYPTIISVPEDSDLVIKGVGFINFKSAAEIQLNIDNKELVEVRTSIFGGNK